MTDKIRIVIVDDHPLFREGVVQGLNRHPQIEVVGEGMSGNDAFRLCGDLLPDVLLLDIGIPGGGLQAAQDVTDNYPVTKIIMLTASEQQDDLMAALKAGARAYVLKGVSGRELADILKNVAAGEVYITPTLAAGLLMGMNRLASTTLDKAGLLADLNAREYEILQLVANGRSNREIGLELHLSEKTIKHYMTNILQKLQVRNRVEAAILAQSGGAYAGPKT